MKQVFFLCSANYYRSRFAEHLFNWLAPQAGLDWQADSMGLDIDRWSHLRAMSRYVIGALQERGVPLSGDHRDPKQFTLSDLANADLVIALKEAEHRQMIATQFPLWTNLVEYWHVDDVDCAGPEVALPALDGHVRALIERLKAA
jgi:protein-tyrosine phosphatase